MNTKSTRLGRHISHDVLLENFSTRLRNPRTRYLIVTLAGLGGKLGICDKSDSESTVP